MLLSLSETRSTGLLLLLSDTKTLFCYFLLKRTILTSKPDDDVSKPGCLYPKRISCNHLMKEMTGLTKGYRLTGRKLVNGQIATDDRLRTLFCDLLCLVIVIFAMIGCWLLNDEWSISAICEIEL